MNIMIQFVRSFFFLLCLFLIITYLSSTGGNILKAIGIGALVGAFIGVLDFLLKRVNLRSFNVALLGAFIGYMMGLAILSIFNTFLVICSTSFTLSSSTQELIKIVIFLISICLGSIITLRSCNEIYASIPFVKFLPTSKKKKDLILDFSILNDSRIIDLSSSGIVDHHLILPSFIIKELHSQAESSNESIRIKAEKSLEVIKKLEELPDLNLRYDDTEFPEIKENTLKVSRLAKLLDANILSNESYRNQIDGIKIISLNLLATSLKPLMQTGETFKIKVQRYGKEPRQGVGYLEDGTMVVINGGGDFIGEIIDVNVLSVKHTTAGRIIFCNASSD